MTSPLGKLVGSLRSVTLRRSQRTENGDPDSSASVLPAAGSSGRLHPGAAAKYGILVGGQSTEDELEAALNDLAPGYFDPPELFDALEHELRQLPVNFGAEQLEAVAEERTSVLEVVSEKLSAHVIHNYDKFVAGVNEVTRVEAEVQSAYIAAKRARESLALAQREVNSNLKIAKDSWRKQGLTALLEALLKLQQAANLQRALKEAQEEGEFAEAFWLCAQCIQSMEELKEGLKVAQELTVTINRLYGETTERLESAMAAVCSDFRPSHYTKVLEGYMFLGNVPQLGGEVQSAFVATITASVNKVVRGVLLTRPGNEEKAASASSLQELLRFLPSDLFRTCLARVLMVLFDILVSHFHMVRWHEAALERHTAELAALQEQRGQLAERMGAASGMDEDSTSVAGSAAASGQDLISWDDTPSSRPTTASGNIASSMALQQPGMELEPRGSSGEVTVTGRAAMQLRRGTASELEEVEARTSDEVEWGMVLQEVHAGLLSGRRLIWEEAARRVGVMLSSPAAFEGEHFLQVMDWTQRLLAVGEAFSGAECTSLRTLLERQSGKFFRLYHHANIEALSSMLDKELWKRLPAELPSLAEVLRKRATSSSSDEGGSGCLNLAANANGKDHLGSSSGAAASPSPDGSSSQPHPLAEFERFVVQGNPWRKQQSPRRRRPAAVQQQLGFGGSAGTDDSRVGRLLDVDEYGVPRTASNAPSAVGTEGVSSSRPGSSQSGATAADGEDDDPFEDLTDDDSQQQQLSRKSSVGPDGGGSGTGGSTVALEVPAVTNSSWRMYKWMRDYSQLMGPLRTAAPSIFAGLCELFELYMLHVFITFSDVSLAQLQHQAAAAAHAAAGGSVGSFGGGSSSVTASAGSIEALTPRLRATLLRIGTDSIGKYKQLFGAQPGSKLARALGGGAAASATAGPHPVQAQANPAAPAAASGASQYFRRTLPGAAYAPGAPQPPHASMQQQPAAAANGAAAMPAAVAAAGIPSAAEISVVSHPGNLYGLLERSTAAESLLAVATQLQRARGALAAALPPGEASALDSFFSRTVGAAEDLQDFVLRTAARLLLPLRWVPERLGATNWALAEPPTGHSPWVDELRRHLEVFRDRLDQVPGLDRSAVHSLWAAAGAHIGEACLEGFARAKRCSLEGRAAMSLDLQGVQRVLSKLLPPGVPLNLRLVDSYIKAFYIPLPELPHWAATHPEYTPQQVLALTSCIAESSGLKKKDKAALVAQVEADLRALA